MRSTRPFLALAGASACLAAALGAACASRNAEAPPAASVVVPHVPRSDAPGIDASTDASRDALASSDPVADAASAAGGCGCKLCQPVVSDDPCTTDADCAPEVPCHATRCVAKARATPRRPGQACTMSMMCTSVDANACGCVANRCTLHARGT